jgi:hypothetical protein
MQPMDLFGATLDFWEKLKISNLYKSDAYISGMIIAK